MILGKTVVKEALTWLGTPYHHKAAVKGVGVDCAMLVGSVAKSLKLLDSSVPFPNYSTQWHLHNREELMLSMLQEYGCIEINPKEDCKVGDILTFKYGRVSSHLGILINNNQIIHAREDVGSVVINDLNEDLLNRWTNTYRLPGVK